MDDKRKNFTYIWEIKNFSCNFNDALHIGSPIFNAHALCQSKWSLELFLKSNNFKEYVVCVLGRRYSRLSPGYLELDYELSFLDGDGSVINSETFRNKIFKKSDIDLSSALRSMNDEVFVLKKHLFLPNDTLTLRCRMWKSQGSISESEKYFVQTHIITGDRSFVGTIKEFSSLKASSKNMMCIKSPYKECPSSMNLCVGDDGKLNIEIKLEHYYEATGTYKFNVFSLNVYGNKVKSCHGEIYVSSFCNGEIYDSLICNGEIYGSSFCIPLTFSREHLLENKELYLPNDVLTLHFNADFRSCHIIRNSQFHTHINWLYKYDWRQAAKTKAKNLNPSSVERHTESLPTLKDDFISLFREGTLSDIKLKTATETFSAHSAVLGARSPVFKSMFANDMIEKTERCVDIEDLDADTVRQMLLFMYSDAVDELDYESARSLYFAADKYMVISLRHRCSDFLKKNLLHSNCCDVLLLADKHQDQDLKRYVQNYIAKNDKAILSSDKWKDLKENYSQLTRETFCAVYKTNQRT